MIQAASERISRPARTIAAVRTPARVARARVVLAARTLLIADLDDAFAIARLARARGEVSVIRDERDAAHALAGGARDCAHEYSLREKRQIVKFLAGRIEFRQQVSRLARRGIHNLDPHAIAHSVIHGILARVLHGVIALESVEDASLVTYLDSLHTYRLQGFRDCVNSYARKPMTRQQRIPLPQRAPRAGA